MLITLIQNALGFFIQFFPCALMIFLPFPQESCRFRRRGIYAWTTVVSAVFSCVYSAVLCLRDIKKYPVHVPISNAFMTAAMLLILAAYIWLVRETLIKKILVFFTVLFYAVTVYVLVNMIAPFWVNLYNDGRFAYNGRLLVLFAGVTVFLLFLMLFVVFRPLGEYIQEIDSKNMHREFFVLILSMMFYFAVTVYCVNLSGTHSGVGYWGVFQQQLLITLFMMLDQVLIYWLVFRESVRRKRDDERQRAMEIQQLQYEKIVSEMENTRRMRHDLRHHYNALNDMLDRGKTEEMKNYLARVIDTTVRRDNESYCQNMMVNGLLQYYIGLARDEDIRCEVSAVCGELPIEPADMTVLLGNAMENAINACRKCPENRWINIQMGTVQGSLAIEISNACRGALLNRRFQTEGGFSPAEAFVSERPGGGYGLRSIARTAHKYDGSASFRYNAEKEMFTARIRLNIHKDM